MNGKYGIHKILDDDFGFSRRDEKTLRYIKQHFRQERLFKYR